MIQLTLECPKCGHVATVENGFTNCRSCKLHVPFIGGVDPAPQIENEVPDDPPVVNTTTRTHAPRKRIATRPATAEDTFTFPDVGGNPTQDVLTRKFKNTGPVKSSIGTGVCCGLVVTLFLLGILFVWGIYHPNFWKNFYSGKKTQDYVIDETNENASQQSVVSPGGRGAPTDVQPVAHEVLPVKANVELGTITDTPKPPTSPQPKQNPDIQRKLHNLMVALQNRDVETASHLFEQARTSCRNRNDLTEVCTYGPLLFYYCNFSESLRECIAHIRETGITEIGLVDDEIFIAEVLQDGRLKIFDRKRQFGQSDQLYYEIKEFETENQYLQSFQVCILPDADKDLVLALISGVWRSHRPGIREMLFGAFLIGEGDLGLADMYLRESVKLSDDPRVAQSLIDSFITSRTENLASL